MVLTEMTAKKRSFPRADWTTDSQVLMHVMLFVPASKLAQICRVPLQTAEAWQAGREPVPYAAFALMQLHHRRELPDCFEQFAGWRLIESKLVPPGGRAASDGLCVSDWPSRREMHLLRNLADRQAELISSLTRQRDFYRRQVRLEARAGLMLRNWFTS